MSTQTMNREQANELIKKYNNGTATTGEKALLDNWFLQESQKFDTFDKEGGFLLLKDEIWEQTLRLSGLSAKSASKRYRLWPLIAASVVLVGLASSLFFYVSRQNTPASQAIGVNDVAPGGSQATLTLANGKKIILTDADNGSLAQQAGVEITKLADGEIVYTVSQDNQDNSDELSAMENTISTPNGGKYTVILPDGSKVTLNAASSLTFPTAFKNGERQVKLDGEAYFEVAKIKDMPFSVMSQLQKVEVLGTHFNVNAYADETAVRTTLVEGSVKVVAGNVTESIVPGQQTEIERSNNSRISKKYVDIEAETAWKNDVFSFDNADVKSVMRQLSRWYDVKVIYVGQFPDEKFVGEISRKSNLSGVAKILELNNIRLEVAGKIVKVSYVPNSFKKQ